MPALEPRFALLAGADPGALHHHVDHPVGRAHADVAQRAAWPSFEWAEKSSASASVSTWTSQADAVDRRQLDLERAGASPPPPLRRGAARRVLHWRRRQARVQPPRPRRRPHRRRPRRASRPGALGGGQLEAVPVRVAAAWARKPETAWPSGTGVASTRRSFGSSSKPTGRSVRVNWPQGVGAAGALLRGRPRARRPSPRRRGSGSRSAWPTPPEFTWRQHGARLVHHLERHVGAGRAADGRASAVLGSDELQQVPVLVGLGGVGAEVGLDDRAASRSPAPSRARRWAPSR